MNSENLITLKSDPVLERLVQPVKDDQKAKIESDILAHHESIIIDIWNGITLYEFEKYNICQRHRIPFSVKEHNFPCIEEAASYICSAQLNRKDLTGEYRKYLIGQKFRYEEAIYLSTQPEKANVKYRIAYKIGEGLNLSGGTVLKYGVYSSSIDTIYDSSEELAQMILLAKVRVSHENVIELSRLTSDEIKNLSRSVMEDGIDHLTFPDIRHEVKWRYTQTKAPVSRRERKEQKERVEAGIRQMPLFDPDSEVNSLCMTIVSWVSSIERVSRSTDYSTISSRAKLELMKQLTVLEQTINTMQKSLVERTMQ